MDFRDFLMKIISLVPSITETLFDFGLTKNQIVGRTKFCIHPKNLVREVEVIGGTKNLNIEKIKSINPDFIIANKEENEKLQVEELAKDFKVWVTNVGNLEDNYYFLKMLGNHLGMAEKAQLFNLKIQEVMNVAPPKTPLKVCYLIWKNPYMTVGGDTFISDALTKLGFENIFKNRKRYPEISVEEMKEADCIFLSSEPFPFQQKHIDELQELLAGKKIMLVDGEAFSWFGTHLAKRGNYFDDLLKIVATKL